MENKPKKKRNIITVSTTADTIARIKQFAFENHMNVSQAITQLIWKAKVKNSAIKGQISIDEVE